MKRSIRHSGTGGFTIVELMIATAVFAIVLMVVTTGIMQVTRVYYKGLTEANTQDAARSIMDSITQAIQFNGGAVSTTPASPSAGASYAFCVGNQQYSYTLGYELMDTPDPLQAQTYHALVVDTLSGCSASSPAQNVRAASITGRELLSPRMRLSNLSVTNVGANLYRVQVRVVYGDDDLLNNPTTTGAVCQSVRAGTQFCALSDLSSVVIKRVE